MRRGYPRLKSVELGGPGRWLASLARLARSYSMSMRPPFEGEEGDGSAGAGDLTVELLADDAFSRPAQAITVEAGRPAEIGYRQRRIVHVVTLPW